MLFHVLTPICVIAGLGYLFRRTQGGDATAMGAVTFYLLSPMLVFTSLSELDLDTDLPLRMVAFGLLMLLALGGVGWALARVMKLPSPLQSAFLLVVLSCNAGNYGLPVNLFAFGDEGLQLALIYFLVNSLTVNSVGLYIVTAGRAAPGAAFAQVIKVPLLHAGWLGLLFNWQGWALPEPVFSGLYMMGQAAIPAMLITLGMQLAGTRVQDGMRPIAVATLVKLVLAPLIAVGMTILIGLDGVARAVAILQASMPTAVMASIVATQYDASPKFVATVVFISTLASLGTISLLLLWLT